MKALGQHCTGWCIYFFPKGFRSFSLKSWKKLVSLRTVSETAEYWVTTGILWLENVNGEKENPCQLRQCFPASWCWRTVSSPLLFFLLFFLFLLLSSSCLLLLTVIHSPKHLLYLVKRTWVLWMLEGINYVACCHGQQKGQFLFSISCLCNTVINFVKCCKKVLWMHAEKLFHSLLNERVDS